MDLTTKIYKRKERIALAEMLPNVALAANYFVTNPNVFNGFKNDFAGMFNVGVMVKVPCPVGGKALIGVTRRKRKRA